MNMGMIEEYVLEHRKFRTALGLCLIAAIGICVSYFFIIGNQVHTMMNIIGILAMGFLAVMTVEIEKRRK